jgi:hypothetical protein
MDEKCEMTQAPTEQEIFLYTDFPQGLTPERYDVVRDWLSLHGQQAGEKHEGH